jgi:hypothetical protein
LKELPPPGKSEEIELVRFVKDRAYRSSPLYADDFSGARRAELYDQGEQWLRRAYTTRDSRSPSQWIRMDANANDPTSIPMPVYNECVALRENESSRLGRPEYKPRVRPRGENPDITAKEGAKGAERALISRLKQMAWEERQEQLCFNLPTYGGSYLFSYWDQTWMDTVRVPTKAVICSRNPKSRAGQAAAQPFLPPAPGGGSPVPPASLGPEGTPMHEGAEPGLEAASEGEAPITDGPFEVAPGGIAQAAGEMGGGYGFSPVAPEVPCSFVGRADAHPVDEPCPLCSAPLEDYQPSMEEAQGDLGDDWPKGDWELKPLWPYNVFPRDAGVGVDPTDIDEWVYVHVETLDWLAQRYPDKVRDYQTGELKIHPEHPTALMAEDPTMGSPLIFQSAQHTDVFRNHVLIYEYFRKPWLQWDEQRKAYLKNDGRYVVCSQGRVCFDGSLLVQSLNDPSKKVARARLEFVVWEPKEGGRRSTVGQSLWGRLFDVQDGINKRMAQVWAVNERGAVPWYLQARGRNFETRAADAAVPFRRVMVDIDPQDKQPPLTLMQNTTIDGGVYTELEWSLNHSQRVSGQVEVERGQVPPNVAAATAIAYLKTESGEKRRPRIKRIRNAFVRQWDHGLQLMAGLYIEPREYSYEDEFSEEREAFISGDVIASANPKVDIYPTPDYDQADSQRESIRDMVQLGILKPDQTPQLNRKLVKTLEPSLEFFLEDDLQEDQAEREWRDFKERGVVPVIDPSLDDPMTHYQLHGQACFSAWFREMEKKANWDGALAVIGNDWDNATLQIAMTPIPGTSIQVSLFMNWRQQLQRAGMIGMWQPGDDEALEVVLQWRAHTEAHKLRALIQQSGIKSVGAPATGSSPEAQSEQPEAAGGAPQGQVVQ